MRSKILSLPRSRARVFWAYDYFARTVLGKIPVTRYLISRVFSVGFERGCQYQQILRRSYVVGVGATRRHVQLSNVIYLCSSPSYNVFCLNNRIASVTFCKANLKKIQRYSLFVLQWAESDGGNWMSPRFLLDRLLSDSISSWRQRDRKNLPNQICLLFRTSLQRK